MMTNTFPIVMAYGGDRQPWPMGKGAGVGSGYELKIQDNRPEFPGPWDFTLHGQIFGFRGGPRMGNPPSNRGGNYGGAEWLKTEGHFGEVQFDCEQGEFFAHSDNLAALVLMVYALRNAINPDCNEPIAQSGGRDLSEVRVVNQDQTVVREFITDACGSSTEAWMAMLRRELKQQSSV